MTRKSEYSDEYIKAIIKRNGYTRISGYHKNGLSKHVLKHSCGMINIKTSKTLLSNKKSCRFSPCHPRGALSLLYIRKIAKAEGVDNVIYSLQGEKKLDELVISSRDKLTWLKNNEVMTQSWYEVRTRAFGSKNGTFFIADDHRHKITVPKLTAQHLEKVCKLKNLIPPKDAPRTQNTVVEYVHIDCNSIVPLSYKQIDTWSPKKCRTCFPNISLNEFNAFLKEKGMVFEGELIIVNGKRQVKRNQKIVIKCLKCDGSNNAINYDLIRYRGFCLCDNKECKNAYNLDDIVGKSAEYYIELFDTNQISKFSQAQQFFPKICVHLKRARHIDLSGIKKTGEMYRVVRNALGWECNELPKDFTYNEVKIAIKKITNTGLKDIGTIRTSLPNNLNNYLNRTTEDGRSVLHEVLDELNIPYKQKVYIKSFEDAVNFIDSKQVSTWGEIASQYPKATEIIKILKIKEKIFKHYGWISLDNFSRLSDSELLNEAFRIFNEDESDLMSNFEKNNSGLIRNIRERELIDKFYDLNGSDKLQSWQGRTYNQILNHVVERLFVSVTEWHCKCSGSYKYANDKDWIKEIVKELDWQIHKGLDGYSYDSRAELIVANILYLHNIKFISHQSISKFRGIKGGKSFTDFYIENRLWLEVWAYSKDDDMKNSKMPEYQKIREHKENGYRENHMELCSIEGGLLYRSSKLDVDGISYKKGLDSLVCHTCKKLAQFGIEIECNKNLLDTIRQSIIK